MSSRCFAWTLVAVACVLTIGATVSKSRDNVPEDDPAGKQALEPVGRFVPYPLPTAPTGGFAAMDTTNGQVFMLQNNKKWVKIGPPIVGYTAAPAHPIALPDPTGKLRPRPEEDFNEEPKAAEKRLR